MNSSPLEKLQQQIEFGFVSETREKNSDDLILLQQFRSLLNAGTIRVAELVGDEWQVHAWVRKGILLHARWGVLKDVSAFEDGTCFDFDTLPPRRFSKEDSVRVPAGGTLIRDGCYLAEGVVCMPPSVINIGAWIGARTSIDSHVTIGTCSQIGADVRISSGTQIGGVIQPFDAFPTIIGDGAVIGGNCGIYDGVCVGEGAVIGAGTILTAQSRVYDFRTKRVYRSAPGKPLLIPPLSIVVPGARPLNKGLASESGLLIQMPVIVGQAGEMDAQQDLLDGVMD